MSYALLALAVFGLITSTVFAGLVLAAVPGYLGERRRALAALDARPGFTPPLTLLKPVHGDEPGLEAHLATFFEQDYPEYEILFCARAADDAGLATARRVAERYPRLQLIADHMGIGGNTPKEGRIADAVSQTASLAKYPNVSVKLSAAPNYSSEAYPFRDFTPHIQRLFEAYGPKRCHWGSDMTNGYDKATYQQRITHFTEELPFLSEADKDWVMGKSILERLRWA